MEVYNKNRDNNQSLQDEIREQNAKLKDAPLKEKLDYFKEYYLKATLLIAAAVALVGYLAYSMITSPSDTAFAAFFYNNTGDPFSDELLDGFVASMNIDTKKHKAYIDASMIYGSDVDATASYTAIEKTMAVMSTKELDIIIGDAPVIDYYSAGECFHDVTAVLPKDLLDQFGDRLYYATTGDDNLQVPVGIYVDDSPKLNKYHYYDKSRPILGFIANSDSLDNAIAFLRYIYDEEIE